MLGMVERVTGKRRCEVAVRTEVKLEVLTNDTMNEPIEGKINCFCFHLITVLHFDGNSVP